MKFDIQMNYSSEDVESDLGKLTDIIMGAVDRYFTIVAKNKTESEVNELRATLHGLDNRLDGVEARTKLNEENFKEVETMIASSDKKSSK